MFSLNWKPSGGEEACASEEKGWRKATARGARSCWWHRWTVGLRGSVSTIGRVGAVPTPTDKAANAKLGAPGH